MHGVFWALTIARHTFFEALTASVHFISSSPPSRAIASNAAVSVVYGEDAILKDKAAPPTH